MTFDNAIETMRKVITPGCYDNDSWCERYDNCEKCRLGAIAEIQSAHNAEMEHMKKTEYHRGYEDGKKYMDADEWQLYNDRHDVASRLRQFEYRPVMTEGTQFNSALLLSAILGKGAEPSRINDWWDAYDELVRLLATEPDEEQACESQQDHGTDCTVPNLYESPDLPSCHELGKLLRKALGEAKCVHDKLKDQSKSHSDLKAENQRLKAECRRYRALLGEAATQYGDLYEMAMTDDRMYREMLNDAAESFKWVCNTSFTYLNQTIYELRSTVRDLEAEAETYLDLLKDAKKDYVRIMDERDELRMDCTEYNLAITGYKERMAAFVESERLRRELEAERDKLRRDVALWRDRSEDMRKERDDAESERDRYKAACEAAQSLNRDMMDGLKNYVKLPVGEDGEHIRMGDTVRFGLTGEPFEVSVITFYAKDDAFVADESNEGARAKYCNHVTQPDPIEETFREYELGNLTSSEAIEKIREATNVG